jgi:HK97 gp10 family phage protein
VSVRVTFEGGKELQSTLDSLPQAISRKIQREVLVEAAEPMVAAARKMAPRRPGFPDIADNIEVGTPRTSKTEAGDKFSVSWGPTTGFFYGHFQEYGTAHHAAQPFMRPAFDGYKEKSLNIITTRLWDHIQSYVLSRDVL